MSTGKRLTATDVARLSKLEAHVLNANQLHAAYVNGEVIPPLRLKSGLTIHHRPRDPIVSLFWEIFVEGCYVGHGFYTPRPSDVVVDCGANIGVAALHLWSLAPGIRTFCFEPCGDTADALRANVTANGLEKEIAVFQFGIWASECRQELHVHDSSGDASFLPRPRSGVADESASCISLRQALVMCGIDVVDLLKLDVEGAEIEVLRGADPADWKRIRRVALEYHDFLRPGCCDAAVDVLERNGFDVEVTARNPGQGVIRASRAGVS